MRTPTLEAAALLLLLVGSFAYSKIVFPQLRRKALANSASLVKLDNDYRRNLWRKMESKVRENLLGLSVKDLWSGYGRSLSRIDNFLNFDLKKYYEKIVN